MRQTLRLLLSRKITLLVSVFALSLFSANAQFFKQHSTMLWLKSNPEEQIASDSTLIGNYHGIDLSNPSVKEKTDALASINKGTVFFALGTSDSTTEEALLKFGRIRVYRAFMLIAGDTIKFDKDLGKSPGIVRASYSFTGGNGYFPANIKKHENSILTEILYFEDLLDKEEIRQVESYLALKYSINITSNEEPKLRDYVDGENEKLWSAKSDNQFDEEVIALGRVDSLEWNQTQTFTADASSIKVSLDTFSLASEMPKAILGNNSMLIMAKSGFSPENLLCGEGLTRRLWKLRFKDWQYTGAAFYITLNEEIKEEDFPVLSNGYDQISLKVRVSNGASTITIPFFDDLYSNRYFIMWGGTGIKCTPLCQVMINNCNQEKTQGSINLQIDQDGLPAEVEIFNLSNNQYLKQTVYEPSTIIENLNSGDYQLVVKNGALILADQVMSLENCASHASSASNVPFLNTDEKNTLQNGSQANQGASNTESKNGSYTLNPTSTTLGISTFPNPVNTTTSVSFSFNGLHDKDFNIEIFDDAGSFHSSERFTPTNENYILEHDFKVPGVYMVRFLSSSFSDYVKVVINN